MTCFLKPERQEKFLEAYAEYGTVRAASNVAGISYWTHDKWKQRDPEYALRFLEAQERFRDRIEEAAFARGIDGVDEPIVNKDGEITGYKKRYSDTVLLAIMNAKLYERNYRHNARVEVGGQISHQHDHRLIDARALIEKPEATRLLAELAVMAHGQMGEVIEAEVREIETVDTE